jgi:ubiquinone biosynthesis protein UbiJ
VSAGPQIPDAALAAFEQALNRYIALDPEGARRLAPIHGRVICLELSGFGTRVFLIPGPAGLQVYGDYAAEPDCLLRGSPFGLARMGISHRKEEQLFSGEVQVEGDTAVARAFGDFAAGLEPDWEEQLARLVGDPVAYQVGSGVRGAADWGRRTIDTLAQDVKEYLQEEGRILPTRYEVEEFLGAVDTLRDDVERLDARVERLRRRLGEHGQAS